MAPYDDWNKIDDEEEEELQDASLYEGKRDVILFCIDCSPSMLELYEDPRYEDVQTSKLFTALEAAMQIQKRKVLVGPNDSIGIVLFNTTKRNESGTPGADIKKGTYVYQPIATVDAPKVMELVQLLNDARENPELLAGTFPPQEKRVPVGDVFTSCNWVIRDGAPKTATKRVFFITDEDNPHPGAASTRLITSARTTLIDLVQAGVTVEPFFISTEEKPFDPAVFYSSVLLATNITDSDEVDEDDPSMLPEAISIGRIEELLAQMRFHEVPKRAAFSVPFCLAPDFVIGVKGYGLVTEQKKGTYRYFADLGDRMDVVASRTAYVDEEREAETERSQILFGMDLGAAPAEAANEEEGQQAKQSEAGARTVPLGCRVFYTAEEVRSFRTLGLEPGIKLLGFKSRKELAFEDNVKHSFFIYPDEMTYAGSKRAFTALLRTMISKKKIAIALALTRRNSSPIFCAVLPQAEKVDESGWREPPGFHLVPLPFADDIRAAPVEKAFRASDEVKEAARKWIDKLSVKNGSYPPDSYPNPALAYHNTQLEASAFREEFDADAFEDLTEPKYDMIHKRAGQLMKAWKQALQQDESANIVAAAPVAGTKRKADVSVDEAEIRSKYDAGTLTKLRVDQLKDFLKSKGEPVSGKKADLVGRVAAYLDSHA